MSHLRGTSEGVRFSRHLSEVSDDERRFIEATALGDLGTIRSLLEAADDETSSRLINAVDENSRSILEIATESDHLEIVEYVSANFSWVLSYDVVHECIMIAISKGYVRTALVLLNHPLYVQIHKNLSRLGSITNYYQDGDRHVSRFDRDLTPLKLAAHHNQIEIIRILLERGERVKYPHMPYCDCDVCENRRRFDPLKHSMAIINSYKALASPAYVSLTSHDPVLTSFLLCENLKKLVTIEKEFKSEYTELVQQCKNYASNLLDACQSSQEVSLMLNQKATTTDQLKKVGNPRREEGQEDDSSQPGGSYHGRTLERLKLAILYEQKQFVSHPYCQHLLSTIWYGSIPAWRRIPAFPLKLIIPLLAYIGTPVWATVYWIAPTSRVGQIVSSPLAKFITHTVAYLLFLFSLYMQSVYAESTGTSYSFIPDPCDVKDLGARWSKNPNESLACVTLLSKMGFNNSFCCEDTFRRTGLNVVDIVIIVLLIGMLWAEVKQIWVEGHRRYFASKWNWIDMAMLTLYSCSYAAKIYAQLKNHAAIEHFLNHDTFCLEVIRNEDPSAAEHVYFLHPDRKHWTSSDPIFLCEALFAVANILSFSRLSYILPVSDFLGPLQISLGRMIKDIARFGAVFIVVFLAFFCSFLNLYWFLKEGSDFGTFESTFLTLFWSLFGMAESTSPIVDDTFKHDGNSFLITSWLGTALFAIYHIVMALVMLNMLIAMMNNSFEEIESDRDAEWRFSRAKLWMAYFEDGATLPPPFNIIPSPKSVYRVCRWFLTPFQKLCCKKSSLPRKRRQPIRLKRVDAFDNASNRDPLSTNESIAANKQGTIDGIVKRYLFKLQTTKDDDEVNEGELDEIKNDISSLRFELLGLLKSNHTNDMGPSEASKPNKHSPMNTSTRPMDSRGASMNVSTAMDLDMRFERMETKISELGNAVDIMREEVVRTLRKLKD